MGIFAPTDYETIAITDRLPTDRREPDRTVWALYATDAGNSISNDSETIIDYEDKEYDTHNAVTVGAAWKFTAPVTGIYAVKASIMYAGSTAWNLGEYGRTQLYKNGSLERILNRIDNYNSGGTTLYMNLQGSTDVYLEVGDYIDARAYHNTGGALAIYSAGGAPEINFISVKLTRM